MKYVYVPLFSAQSRNVLFSPETELLFKEMDIMSSTDSIKKFVKTKFRNWLANTYPAQKHVPSPSDPAWVERAIARGDTVYYVNVAEKDAKKYKDYLYVLNLIKPPKLDKMSVEQVREQCDAYIEKEARKRGTKLVTKCDGGYYWVELTNSLAIRGEGHDMNNCLKTFDRYAQSVANGTMRIFSLRDAKDKPHVDIEYNVPEKRILQLKGNSNTIPKEIYRKAVIDFLNCLEVEGEEFSVDIAQMWLAKVGGKFVSLPDALDNKSVFDNLIVPPSFTQKYPDLNELVSKKNLMFTSVQANSMKSLVAGHIHFVNSRVGEIQLISTKKDCYFSNSRIDIVYDIKSKETCYFRDSEIRGIYNITCGSLLTQESRIDLIQNAYIKDYLSIRDSTINVIGIAKGGVESLISDSTLCMSGKSLFITRPMFKNSQVSFKKATITKLGFENSTVMLDGLTAKEISFSGDTKVFIKNPKNVKIETVLLGDTNTDILVALRPLKDSVLIEADNKYKQIIEMFGLRFKNKKVKMVSFETVANNRFRFLHYYEKIPVAKDGVMLAANARETKEYKEFCAVVGQYLLCDI